LPRRGGCSRSRYGSKGTKFVTRECEVRHHREQLQALEVAYSSVKGAHSGAKGAHSGAKGAHSGAKDAHSGVQLNAEPTFSKC
jgi:hypothetical protein